MPTYEFRCPKGHDFEKFNRSMAASPMEMVCPVCGALASRQMSAGAGLVFKGSGFYITDYGKDGKKDQRPAPAGESKPASESTSGSSSDAPAPAASAAAKPAAPPPASTAAPSKPSE